MGMDIHECFEYKLKSFNEMVAKINEKPKEDEEIDLDKPYISQWDHFESFLRELISDDHSRFKSAILWLFFADEELELHEKMKNLFNILTDFDDKQLISMVYDSGCDRVKVDFDKSESIIHME